MKTKLKSYIIQYSFNGFGNCEVSARNKEEAKEMFFNGEFSDDEEGGENYTIDFVEDINSKWKNKIKK